jgi:hypothetical protein
MKKLAFTLIFLALLGHLRARSLVLEQTIQMLDVTGRVDHLSLDAEGGRLFVAALGDNMIEVIDLKQGTVARSLTGFSQPQGVVYVPEFNRLYVTNSGDGTLQSFDGTSLLPLNSWPLGDDADNIRYDATAKQVLAGYGSGGIAIVDAVSGKIKADVSLDAHPEAFQMDQTDERIFVNVPLAHEVAVVNRHRKKVTDTWSIGFAAGNFSMALDEADHRLFVGCRLPACLLVLDTASGQEVAKLDLHGDCDDLYFDAARRQVYVSCGKGCIDIFKQTDADHYKLKESVATAPKARTCLFDGSRIYLAVPRRKNDPAEIRCYRILDQ